MKPFIRLITLGLLLTACDKPEENTSKPPAKPKPIQQVVGIARIEPEQGLIDMYAGASGRITKLFVAENGHVEEGQTLLTIDPSTDQTQVAQARARIRTQQAAIAAQEATLATLKLEAEKAREDAELNQKLVAVKAATPQALRDSEVNALRRQQEYQKGIADLNQTRTKLAELQADVTYYRTMAAQKVLRSSFAGNLLEWKVSPGDYVTAGSSVAQLAPDGALIARTEVDELFAERVQTGQRADIRSQATGKLIGSGEVYFLADYLKRKSLFEDETSQEDRRVREVRIKLKPGAKVLINGRVDCIIHLN